MNISKNSLVSKMIKKTFWWLGKEGKVCLPKTSCGYLFAGILSGVFHVVVLLSIITFLTGFIEGALSWVYKIQGVDYHPLVSNTLLSEVGFTISTAIPLASVLFGFLVGIASPVIILILVLVHLFKNNSEKISRLVVYVARVLKLRQGCLMVWATLSRSLNKLSVLCKDIEYKEK